MGDPLVWLYAITGSSDHESTSAMTGLAGAPVRVVRSADLAAVVSTVDSAAFGEQALRRNLEDLDWVTSVAHAHDAVVRSVAHDGGVVPLRLASIYASDEHVRRLLDERHDELTAALRLVRGRTEWGVKAYAAGKAAHAPGSPPTSGMEYLRRRREQLSSREDAERTAGRQVQDVHSALASLAVAARTHPPRNTPLNKRPEREILNGAYLVDGSRTEAFHAAVQAEERRSRALHLVLTGPWPPYSFTTLTGAQP